MNESLFFIHILIVLIFSYVAYRCGKEGLITWIAIQSLLANLFVLKQISFFSFHVPCSDVFAVGSILSLNLLQEFYGKKSRQQATLISFLTLVAFTVLSQVHLLYDPSSLDTLHPAYESILSASPRILAASITAFLLTQVFDGGVFSSLQKTKLSLPLRNGIALSLSQIVDTVLFSFLGLYGLVASIQDTIILSSLIKILIILILTGVFFLSKKAWRHEI